MLVYVAIAAAAVAVLLLVVYPRVRSKLFKTEVAVTEIAMVSPAQASIQLTSTGYVVPQVVSKAAAKVPGRVLEARKKQGDQVVTGDVLLVLDMIDQKAAITAARARVASARANAETARANLAEIQQQLKREVGLSEQGVTPKATAEDMALRANALKAAAKAADAMVQAAQADVDTLEVYLKSYTLTSPIDGKILSKVPEVGEFVGPAMAGIADAAGSIEIASFSSLAVETDVPEGRLNAVKEKQPTEIVLDAFPERRLRGEVLEIVPRVNRAKATVVVKVKFVDETTGVLPDMSARVSFLSGELDAAAVKEPPKLIIPGSAIAERGGGKVVFVLEDGRVRMIPIEIGKPFGDGFELLRGPKPGTRVVAKPGPDLVDGQQVKERTDG